MLNRRRMLALGATVGGAMALPLVRAAAVGAQQGEPPHRGYHVGRRTAATAVRADVTPFSVRMPVPPVLRPASSGPAGDVYRIPVRAATAEILPGVRTQVLGYGGGFGGPTIRARAGRPVRMVYENTLDAPVNVHLHGGHVPAASDGHPMDLIQPGGSRAYDYPNTQRGATLWYHDHSHGTEAEHVYRGLHGFYLIEGEDEAALRLPAGPYDVPIMLRDSAFDANGELIFFGDPAERSTFLANGKVQPYFPVAARKYRFRLLNAGNERVFRLNLGGVEMIRIGSDGGLLPAPVPVTELVLASAERADIVVDFGRHPVGTRLVLSDGTTPVLRFDVVAQARDTSRVPDRLRPMPSFPAAAVERDVAMSFDLSGSFPVGLVNGRPYDPDRVDFQVKRGTTEIWRVINADTIGIDHTFHMHLAQFEVLDRDGAPPLPQDAGLKDTVHVPPGGSVRVRATFTDHLGRYVYHCHYLEHSSIGMMGQMEVIA
ncbi:multicopper oxidase [Sphaerisporangium rufum]|uniref:Multicopper oxidase CueO n=1 Tax=Sphaerisporangium rufum TaxID=1381558 RepID=A0A919R5G6_9ACTN|nr:multicopper oxidase domain-containing protein [Sphaerisporangium rufum]GII77555.1 multicopper oxidase [Sphaerisporangium rufum]